MNKSKNLDTISTAARKADDSTDRSKDNFDYRRVPTCWDCWKKGSIGADCCQKLREEKYKWEGGDKVNLDTGERENVKRSVYPFLKSPFQMRAKMKHVKESLRMKNICLGIFWHSSIVHDKRSTMKFWENKDWLRSKRALCVEWREISCHREVERNTAETFVLRGRYQFADFK